MKTETFRRIELSRQDLERAVAAYCGLSPDVKLDGFWVDSTCWAAPRPVCGFSYSPATPPAPSDRSDLPSTAAKGEGT